MVDLFSGGGAGWCLAARALGLESVGIEWDPAACGTRAAVGLRTIRADVAQYPAEIFAGKVNGLTGSPPCQSFSTAGKGAGLADPRGLLVREPLRWVRATRPRWVALEQVPEVLIYWRAVRDELVALGYSSWCGVLDAADFGVPQNRRRAILLASLDRVVQPPAPTHSKTGADGLFGPTLLPWATMAEALGWDGRIWTNSDNGTDDNTYERPVDEPAPTVTSRGDRWKLRTPGRSYDAPARTADPLTEPAPSCVALGHNASSWCWERPATTVQCDPRIARPGHKGDKKKERNAVRQMEGAIPVQPWELGVLQGFPPDHPWQPPYVARQIGNAVPPPLAEACLRAVAA